MPNSIEINRLGAQLTAFRRLLYFVMINRNFWNKYAAVGKFQKKYALNFHQINYDELELSADQEKTRVEYFEDPDISHGTIRLYLAMEVIYDDPGPSLLPMAYDELVEFKYSIETLDGYSTPCNCIWNILHYRLSQYGYLFNELALLPADSTVDKILPQIHEKYRGQKLSFKILSEMAEYVGEIVLKKMSILINANTGIPYGLIKTFINLILIMFFGLIYPLGLASIQIPVVYDTILTLVFICFTILTLINFLFDFGELFVQEIHPNK